MNQGQLKKALVILKEVSYYNLIGKNETLQKIITLIIDNKVSVLSKSWGSSWRNTHPELYPLDLTNREVWRTFDDCISMKFWIKNNNLHCDVIIWEGESYHGTKTDRRFSAEIVLPFSFLKEIKEVIVYKFDQYLENKYEVFLKEQALLWMNALKQDLLK